MTKGFSRAFTIVPFCLACWMAHAQGGLDLSVGKVSLSDLLVKSYARDTAAVAVVLDEVGKTYISQEQGEALIFQRYVKIKILKKQGMAHANFEIPLHKQPRSGEQFVSVAASTFNLVNGELKEKKMDSKDYFTENRGEYLDVIKFALPDVHVGSVIEVTYILNSPYLFNFRKWEFQSDIPKIHSEYWALIPGVFVYAVTLKGFYPLQKNESSIIRNCVSRGAADAECSLSKYGMDDIPAFVEEDYMTAKRNFISSLNFELAEVRYFDGRVDKKTAQWKDVDEEMRQAEDFGGQIRKAKKLFGDQMKSITTETDTLKKAKAIYDFITHRYDWNEYFGMHTQLGIKSSFENKKGNSGDINLSLTGALQAAGVDAYPVLLSTRENGLPVMLHPVMSDFNYVVASVVIGGTRYLLDATSKFRPFGLLPMRCLNGKGRVMAKESYWIDLVARDKQKKVVNAAITLDENGWHGSLSFLYSGYDAQEERMKITSAGDSYRMNLQNEWKHLDILELKIRNLDSLENPLSETIKVNATNNEGAAATLYFNPFVAERWKENPFKANERLYPVDFGAPLERQFNLRLNFPSNYEIDDLPASIALTLPQAGGRFLFNVSKLENSLAVTCLLTINKAAYNSSDYAYLKEFFERIVQVQQSQIVFKRKG